MVGAVLALVTAFIIHLESRPDLATWHTTRLHEEFTADSDLPDLAAYFALEDRLFAELRREVIAPAGTADPGDINRYRQGSLADPARWANDWNRSYELPQENPRSVVLLLHGLSDSPYSLRHLGATLHRSGAHVLALRIPGHGTAPSALAHTRWNDMAAAVDLALNDLAHRFPDKPLVVLGYSNGGALALNATLDALADEDRPLPSRVVLISPEVGVTPLAAFAAWQARLGRVLGLRKLAWNDLSPEIDPFKYSSFPVNAGDVSYRGTRMVQEKLARLEADGALSRMPPILAFSSVVDATVLPPVLVSRLFNPLPPGEHELVLFDLNRQARVEHFIRWKPDAMIAAVRERPDREYALTLVTNRDASTPNVVARRLEADESFSEGIELGLAWPPNVYSLSHVALAFPIHDPLYGAEPDPPAPMPSLGTLDLRGERGALQVTADVMLRQRWNPFYPYLETRILEFLDD